MMDTIEKELMEHYRSVFSTIAGRKVLTHMLTELHLFDEVTDEEEVCLSNYARRLLHRLGSLSAINLQDGSFVEAILGIPLKDGSGKPIKKEEGHDMV